MLPSTRRPKEVEEERAVRLAELEKQQQEAFKVKIKITKEDIFKRTMAEWYEDMSEKDKKRLTPKQLKRKAINVCFKEKMDYQKLPKDWLTELQTKSNLKLYKKIKKEKKGGDDSQADVRYNPRPIREVRQRGSRGGIVDPSFNEVPESSFALVPTPMGAAGKPRARRKDLLDCTGDPPPPAWTEAYAKGIILPRLLTMFQTADMNILYYDYCPKVKDADGNLVTLPTMTRHT